MAKIKEKFIGGVDDVKRGLGGGGIFEGIFLLGAQQDSRVPCVTLHSHITLTSAYLHQ